MTMRFAPLALSLLLLGASTALAAEDAGETVTGTPLGAPTPEEEAEKKAREACKIEICDILATKEQVGPDVACDIAWTWRETEIVDTLDDDVDWPWGKLVCQSKLTLGRGPMAKAMSEPHYKVVTEPQTVRCLLHQADGEPYVVEVKLTPEVTFKNGTASDAKVNWGGITAPSGIYALLYVATSLDNSTNVLGPEVVRQINKFIRKDCDQVKDELPGRRVN
jgi:hypothetical protein